MKMKPINTTNSLFLAGGITLALGVAAPGARAQNSWTKTGSPGNLPTTAQVTAGATNNQLTMITGTLSSTTTGSERTVAQPSQPDLFEIYINNLNFTQTGASLFSATTTGLPTTIYNPELFLFNSSGVGVFFNDDASSVTRQTTISTTTALTPGLYYLGVGTFGAIPRSGTGTSNSASDIFPDPIDGASVGFNGIYGPTGGGGGSALTRWNISSADIETGSYTIGLTGATFAVAPEPSETAALALGGLLLVGCLLRARRRKQATS